MKIYNVQDVSNWRLCVGCGACAYICPEGKIYLVDRINDGIRPVLTNDECSGCDDCLKVCPGYQMVHSGISVNGSPAIIMKEWGSILEIWEGYAADDEIRYQGSSGGVASALALYCIEKEDMESVLHVGADTSHPHANKTVFSRNRADLLSRTGSRYSPASPCDSLQLMETSARPCAFVGKPCDISGLRKAQGLRPELDKKTGIAIGIFCAGTPSTQGTLDLLDKCHMNPRDVEEIRYRGKGWPGMATVRLKGDAKPSYQFSYKESWGFMQKYRPYRCYLCPDGTSEFADISCGDPWYRQIKEDEKGYSLVIVRTERGRTILHNAMKAGYISLKQSELKILEDSQRNLLNKKGAIWGRLLAMKVLRVPTPRFKGFYLFKNWLSISLVEKLRSLVGTARRIILRKYYRPLKA
jgi:coenzyme F420 hydrogenase subunit beta